MRPFEEKGGKLVVHRCVHGITVIPTVLCHCPPSLLVVDLHPIAVE
jgi:hypothetical protein